MKAAPLLSNATLTRLRNAVTRPAYDRSAVRVGIVHLGVGAFHRAHQAVYTDDVLAGGDLRWGICGVSLRRPKMRDALSAQDGLYTLAIRSDRQPDRLRVIGSLTKMLFAPASPFDVVQELARPSVAIVTLTVTEKGYCRNASTGELDDRHPDIAHDLANPVSPRSSIGLLAAAISARQARGVKPLALLSCDNLSGNGKGLRQGLSTYIRQVFPHLESYFDSEVACPNSVVDRIAPEVSDVDRAVIATTLGLTDQEPVVTEEFTQWIIEEDFRAGRPQWDAAGARFVASTEPFEIIKLRLVNGSHSAIAYLGYLSGYETIAEALADPAIMSFARGIMADTVVTLRSFSVGSDVDEYGAAALERFASRSQRHRTWQVAMDGSQKLPARVLATMRDRLAQGLSVDRHALAVAAWMRYVAGIDEQGRPIDVRDPLATELAQTVRNAGSNRQKLVALLLDEERIFDPDLARHPRFREPIAAALDHLWGQGARATAAAYAAGTAHPS